MNKLSLLSCRTLKLPCTLTLPPSSSLLPMFSNIQAWVASVSLQNLPANCLKLRSKDRQKCLCICRLTSALNFTWDKPASQRTNQFDDEGDLLLHETSVFLPVAMCFWSTKLYQANWLVWQGWQNCSSWSIKSLVTALSWTNTIYNASTTNIYNPKVQYMSKANHQLNKELNYNLANLHDDGNGLLQEIQKYIWNVKCRSGSFAGAMFVADLEWKGQTNRSKLLPSEWGNRNSCDLMWPHWNEQTVAL